MGRTQAQTEVDKVFDDFQKTRGQRAALVTSQVQIQGANVTFCQAHYQGSCGEEKTQVVPCGLGCSMKSSRVKVPTTVSTLGLLVITFRVTSKRMFVEEGISDMDTTLLALRDCSKGLQLIIQTLWVLDSQLSYPKFFPRASATIYTTLGFVWMRFNMLNRHYSDLIDRVARGRKVFRNQGGRIRFSNVQLVLVNTASE